MAIKLVVSNWGTEYPGLLLVSSPHPRPPIGLIMWSPPWLMVRAGAGQQVLIKSSRGGRKVKIIAPSGPAASLLLSAALKQTGPGQWPVQSGQTKLYQSHWPGVPPGWLRAEQRSVTGNASPDTSVQLHSTAVHCTHSPALDTLSTLFSLLSDSAMKACILSSDDYM